jgi:hypothetical protein
LFVVVLEVKSINYMIALWPLAALLQAWLAVSLWDRRHAAVRGLIVAVGAAVAIEAGVRMYGGRRRGAPTHQSERHPDGSLRASIVRGDRESVAPVSLSCRGLRRLSSATSAPPAMRGARRYLRHN